MPRVVDKTALAAKYNLQLEAATFFLTSYSGKASDQLLCYFSKCQRAPFPVPLPGVNDLPSCQPSPEVGVVVVLIDKTIIKKKTLVCSFPECFTTL